MNVTSPLEKKMVLNLILKLCIKNRKIINAVNVAKVLDEIQIFKGTSKHAIFSLLLKDLAKLDSCNIYENLN